MSKYLPTQITGATEFFTVTLAQRGTDTLTRHTDTLRTAVQQIRTTRPFAINAREVLPDHMHCTWTLPEGDSDFGAQWSVIKARFSRAMTPTPPRAVQATKTDGSMDCGKGGFGSIISETMRICGTTSNTAGSIRTVQRRPSNGWLIAINANRHILR